MVESFGPSTVITHRTITITPSGLDFRKKPRGQLAPKFLDLVASTDFLVAKNSGRKLSFEISTVQTVYTAFREGKVKMKNHT